MPITVWGEVTKSTAGKKQIEQWVRNNGLFVFNNRDKTHFSAGTGNFSALDLCVGSPELQMDFQWSAVNEPRGSNPFPAMLREVQPLPALKACPRLWKLDGADGKKWQSWLVLRDLTWAVYLYTRQTPTSARNFLKLPK